MCSGDVIFHCGPIMLPYNVDYVVNGSLLARPPAYLSSRLCRTPEGTASYYGRGRRERSVAPPPSSRYGRVMYPRRTLRAALPEPQACEKGRGGYPCPILRWTRSSFGNTSPTHPSLLALYKPQGPRHPPPGKGRPLRPAPAPKATVTRARGSRRGIRTIEGPTHACRQGLADPCTLRRRRPLRGRRTRPTPRRTCHPGGSRQPVRSSSPPMIGRHHQAPTLLARRPG